MSELTPLTQGSGGELKRVISGAEMVMDDATWNYVMVFPMVTDKTKAEWDAQIDEPAKKAKKLFKDRLWTGDKVKDKFPSKMTKLEFHEAVRAEIARVLSSDKCGFTLGCEISVDEDEKLLKIEMKGLATQQAIADKQEIRMAVKPDQYPDLDAEGDPVAKGQPSVERGCPTMSYSAGKFDTSDNVTPCPLYMRYDINCKDKFQPFREADIIRMIRKRMREFFSLQELEASGVCTQMFPVHHIAQADKFEKMGWTQISAFLRWPGGKDTDEIRDYFGEEVAFFFHWMNFYTRWMIGPGILGFFLFFRRFVMTLDQQRYCQIGFCLAMITWSALFTSKYTQSSNIKMLQWGMQNFDQVASVRKEFKKEKRGSVLETIQNSTHWILATFFMIETVLAVAAINKFRIDAAALNVGETIYGIDGAMAVKMGKYLITGNIKVVDALWAKLSPKLTGAENWRTDQQLKNAMVTKLFMVKFVVYYYPFYYIAFIKEHVEGCMEPCNEGEKGCNDGMMPGLRGCLPMLVENLVIFFGTHIATTCANLVVPMVMTRYKVSSEIKAAQKMKPGCTYSYLQLQSKCPAYLGDTQDFMDLVLALGFVMMFSVALPVMATLSLLTNLMEMRLLAYRTMNVQQRAEPRGQEGIGAWAGIIKTVSYVAVIANAGMAVFVMHPIRDFPLQDKLAIFILVEHIAFLCMFVVQGALPDKDTLQVVIEERNGDLADEISGDQDSPVKVEKTSTPSLSLQKTGP